MKLFCKHEYKYYHTDPDYGIFKSDWMYIDAAYCFVCVKCGKTEIVFQEFIEKRLKEKEKEFKKLEILGKLPSLNNESSLYLSPYSGVGSAYCGLHVTDVLNYYKKVYNVDLKQLPNN